MDILKNYSLKSYNTFGIDVSAARFCHFQGLDDLRTLSDQDLGSDRSLILGGGSNVLFTTDYDGMVIRNAITGTEIVDQSEDHIWIKIGGGVVWHEFVEYCILHNYGGIENLSLIPGTVGAAPMQNIGAYGVELKEVFTELEAYNRQTGEVQVFRNEDCQFGYRESIFKTSHKDKYIILNVTLCLTTSNHLLNIEYGAIRQVFEERMVKNPTIKDICDAVISIRKSKLPDPSEIGNAGSFFKNPIIERIDFEGLKLEFPGIQAYKAGPEHVKVPAGWLIEECGWKGKRINNVGVHEKQALVLVNYGGGTGKELLQLAKDIQLSVVDTFGIELKPEVNIIGDTES